MDKKHELTSINMHTSFSSPLIQPDIRSHLPSFTADSQPQVYLQNSRFDAKKFDYEQPYVILGKSGFLVDYGYRLGYFASTWQGQPNLSLRYQDFKLMLQLAYRRTRHEDDFNHLQLGLWDSIWLIDGEDAALVEQLNKIRNDYARSTLS